MGRARAEAEIRQRVFDIMISEWSGNPRPLSRERLQSALDELRPFRSELAGTPVPNRPVDKASNSSAKEAMDMKSTWHRDKIIAMSFWYEVSTHFIASLTIVPINISTRTLQRNDQRIALCLSIRSSKVAAA